MIFKNLKNLYSLLDEHTLSSSNIGKISLLCIFKVLDISASISIKFLSSRSFGYPINNNIICCDVLINKSIIKIIFI